MKSWHGCVLGIALLACGEDDGDVGNQQSAIGNADCSDPKQNPYAEIACVQQFLGTCFAPTGMCEGVVDVASLGKTTLQWDSGHRVEATPFYDLSSIDFTNPQQSQDALKKSAGSDVVIKGASGNSCATGRSRLDQPGPAGKLCASHTVYTNSAGQKLTYCFDDEGNGSVTCSSNGMSYDVKGGEDSSNCQTGSQAAGGCTIEVKQPTTPQLPGR
jgi:hypothetical protein